MIILPADAKKAKKKERVIRPIRAPRSQRKNYLDLLDEQVKYLNAQTANLSDLLKSGAERQEVARRLAFLSAQAQAKIDALAPHVARSFVGRVDISNKEAMQTAIAKALSVDFATVVDGNQVGALLDQAIEENVGLIKSISQEHFAKVGQAVLDNYRGVPLPGDVSLTQRLMDIGGISKNRAKFIARDQTAKLTGDLNQIRQQDNGIDEYIWKTAKDKRVVGTPGGTYPKGNRGHENHYKREGVKFSWSKPPGDGHPGHAYNCRCYAAPVLDIEKLKAQYI